MSLVPCAGCARHRRAEPTSCPFCGAEATPEGASAGMLGRGSRAAIAFGGLVIVGASAGCFAMAAGYGGPPTPSPSEIDASTPNAADAAGLPLGATPVP